MGGMGSLDADGRPPLASDSIGGRLKHTTLHGQVIELGGDAWSTAANAYVVALAKEFRGAPATAATAAATATTATTATTAAAAATTTTASSAASSTTASAATATATTTAVPARRRARARERRRLDPLNLRVGVVRRRPPSSASSPSSTLASASSSASTLASAGTSAPSGFSGSSGSSGSVTNLETLLLEHPIADLTGAVSETGFLSKLRMNYASRGANGTFESVAAFVATGGLDKYTSLSASAYWSGKHLSQEVADLFVEVRLGRA